MEALEELIYRIQLYLALFLTQTLQMTRFMLPSLEECFQLLHRLFTKGRREDNLKLDDQIPYHVFSLHAHFRKNFREIGMNDISFSIRDTVRIVL